MPPTDAAERSALALEFVHSLEDGLVAYDSQFCFLWLNPAAELLLGMKQSGLAGRSQ